MARMVRTTVIGLLDEDVAFEDVQALIDAKLAEKALIGLTIVRGTWQIEDGQPRRFVKFSKLFPLDVIDHRWNLTLSHEFRDAGYGDVAWKFTEVDSEDPDAENTTVSLQPDLFFGCIEDADGPNTYKVPPAPSGSEAFW